MGSEKTDKKGRKQTNNTAGQQNGSYSGKQHGQYNGQRPGQRTYTDETTAFEDNALRFFKWLGRVFRGGIVNYFEIWRKGERILFFPVILFLFCFIHWVFWLTLVLLLIGLFCGCRYSFSGPHLGRKNVNDAMDKAADKVADMAEEINDGEDISS